ncbi:hypothetical protein QVD17_05454 [Tagetes erecta]|uniref:Uncharacterized protein n=1 Tax=Tagetes erecta TaxID=13708 RepID=A0AAD8LC09_TARER|nr:hypothetical protein QVD17_05454 [Tagetes erecta]
MISIFCISISDLLQKLIIMPIDSIEQSSSSLLPHISPSCMRHITDQPSTHVVTGRWAWVTWSRLRN